MTTVSERRADGALACGEDEIDTTLLQRLVGGEVVERGLLKARIHARSGGSDPHVGRLGVSCDPGLAGRRGGGDLMLPACEQ
jgi:hypothetical protein